MGWQVGFDSRWNRDIGYGVPAVCDHPDCGEAIDRGLGYVCGGEPYGGEDGCGLYFCDKHMFCTDEGVQVCDRCRDEEPPYEPTPDTREWIDWKLTDESWRPWRDEHPDKVSAMKAVIGAKAGETLG
jgi:hypothetical protein